MVKHIVLWKILKDGSKEARMEKFRMFREKTEYLKTIIREIVEATVAYNINENEFDICIDSVFRSTEDLQTYILHPEHLKVRSFLDSIQYQNTVFDYVY